jgi:mannose-6-phosphate isomerase-like protein (cupin superfamily)
MDEPFLIEPDDSKSVDLGGLGVDFKIGGHRTGGSFAVVEHPIEPGRLVMPHTHDDVDEYSYVIEGVVGARIGEHEVEAGVGAYIVKPRGVMHTFWNPGSRPARLLEIISPAKFEMYFAEVAERLRQEMSPEERARVRDEMASRHRIRFDGTWVEDLKRRHHLRLLGE